MENILSPTLELAFMLVVVALAVGFFVVATVLKSPWGINLKPPRACPNCAAAIPRGPRIPADAQEAMWGGYTCKSCGVRLDKWGRPRDESPAG